MGIEIIKVPHGFEHPRNDGGKFEPGAHLEPLYFLSDEDKTCFQIYENVSEGTPVSPVFESLEQLISWLEVQGNKKEVLSQFLEMGHYPSLVINWNSG